MRITSRLLVKVRRFVNQGSSLEPRIKQAG